MRWPSGRRRREQELSEELEAHFRMAVEDRLERGETPEQAWAGARREFGSEALVREVTRRMWPGARLWHVIGEMAVALRTLLRNPRFTVAAVVCIAAGVGVTMTIMSALYSILLRPLPYANADELVMIRAEHVTRGETGATISQEALDAWRAARTLAELGTWRESERSLTGGESEPQRVEAAAITSNLFALLGVDPLHGRSLAGEEQTADGSDVVVLGYELWWTRFGGDEGILGTDIELNDRPHRVVGIMPEGFSFPEGARLWTPLSPPPLPDILFYNGVLARLAPGSTIDRARAEFEATMRGFHARPGYDEWVFRIASLHVDLVGPLRRPVLIFQGAALLVLLLACANVAALLMARAATRRRELAVRAALGADGTRLVAHVLIESLVLALLGGVFGCGIAWAGVRLLTLAFPDGVPSYIDMTLHPPVLAATVVVVLLTALAFGFTPALRAGRTRAAGVLTGGREIASGGLAQSRGRSVLVAAEVAISVVLLAAAMLLVRTHIALEDSLGFEAAGVVSMSVRLPGPQYPEPERRAVFHERLEARLRALPAVTHVSASISSVPLDQTTTSGVWGFRFDDQAEGTEPDEQTAAMHYVAPGYLDVWGVRLVAGRDVTRRDLQAGLTAVVNETFVRRYLPGVTALGRRMILDMGGGRSSDTLRIVGVARDFRTAAPPAELPPTIFMIQPADAHAQTFVLQTTMPDPAMLAPVMRAAVRELDPLLIVDRVQTQASVVERTFWRQSLQRNVIGVFAALALLLAVSGMYGVLSYTVGQRTSELGVRMALGASPAAVLLLVLRQAAVLAAVGIAVGVAGALALNRLLSGLLYGVEAADPLTLAVVSSGLFAVAVCAALRPAVRAARLDPQIAIRDG